MTIRSGINLQAASQGEMEAIIDKFKPGVVLLIDIPNKSLIDRIHSYGGLAYGRRWWDGGEQWPRVQADPIDAANWCHAGLQERYGPVWGNLDGYVGFNEYCGNDKFVNICTIDGEALRFVDLFERYGRAPGPEVPQAYKNDLNTNYWVARNIAEYECHMYQLMSQQAPTAKYGAFSWPPGNPELWQWQLIEEYCLQFLGRFPGDFLSTHNMYWRTANGPWHRDSYDPANEYLTAREFFFRDKVPMLKSVPWLYTEGGLDNFQGGSAKAGWQKMYQGSNRDQTYTSHLKAGIDELAEKAEAAQQTIIGVTYFVTGRNRVWTANGFDFSDLYPAQQWMAAAPKSHTVYQPEPEEVPVYEFELGFLTYAQEHPEVGQPAGALEYAENGDAIQETTAGTLVWWAQQNIVAFYPTGTEITEPEAPPALVPTMDVASYQPTDLTALIAEHGIKHVIVKMYQPREVIAGYADPQDHSRAQVASARANGCTVGAYAFLYAAWDARQQVRDAIALMDECGITPRVLWLDWETYTEANGTRSLPTPEQIRDAIDECRTLGVIPGIYSGNWVIQDRGQEYINALQGIPLWWADWNDTPDLDSVEMLPGLARTQLVGHQYSADGIDLSVMLPEYTGSTSVEPEEPPVDWEARALRAEEKLRAMSSYYEDAQGRLDAIKQAGGW